VRCAENVTPVCEKKGCDCSCALVSVGRLKPVSAVAVVPNDIDWPRDERAPMLSRGALDIERRVLPSDVSPPVIRSARSRASASRLATRSARLSAASIDEVCV